MKTFRNVKTATSIRQNDITSFLADLTYAHARATSDASINPQINETIKEIKKAHKLGVLADRYYQTNRASLAAETLERAKELYANILPYGI